MMSGAKQKSPAFQFYAAEFLADENVVLMTNQEVGCYIKLMAYCWREGSIPSEVSKIARLCGEDGSDMAQLWLAISPCFAQAITDNSRLVHPRLEIERKKQEEHRKERAESGKRGASKRWGAKTEQSDSESHSLANGSAIQELIAGDGSSSSSSSSSSFSTTTATDAGEAGADLVEPSNDRIPPITRGAGEPKILITTEWGPSDHFDTMATMAGIRMDDETRRQRIAEFVSYWLPRSEIKTQADWDHGLLQACIRWKNTNPATTFPPKPRHPAKSALHNFDGVDYSYGVNPDGSF